MLKSGMVIGDRYEILGKIGSGGMSVVYKGKDQKLNRNVAIKVLKSEFREDKNFVRKFREEAQAAACLAHPNIVNVYDVGEEDGTHYIVMELVEGITLKNYIERKGKLTIKEATSIGIQVSMGLEVAHNNEIIHRDIKPQNIMISKDGKVKVMDFGIAKAASSETIASNAMGSVHYTSPEQARGGYSDAKSDIYSLGIVMFEMVTGRVPFDGETTVAVAVKHLQEEMPSPKAYCPELPISLEKIIFKCTEKVVARRYANMTELIADLKQSLQTPDVDFVKKVNVDEAAKTVMITKEDLTQIKKETGRTIISEEIFEEDEKDDDEELYDEDVDDDDDEDDEDDDIDPRLEKIMTIGGVVAAIIILIIIFLLAGKILGFGKFGGSTDKNDSQQTEVEVGETVQMIDVKGMTYDEAKAALNQMGLGIRFEGSEESEEYEDGQIMWQSVEPDTVVEKSTTIEVITAVKKIVDVEIPNVVDETKDDAVYRLEQAGFKVDFSEVFDDDVKVGRVVKTSPAVGSKVPQGSTIVISVSKGPDVKYTTVPKVVGKTKEEAEAAIKSANLSVGNVSEKFSDEVEKGKVITQGLSAGDEVAESTKMDISVSKGPEEVVVPELIGRSKDRATEKLANVNLKVEVKEDHNDKPAGEVYDCTPGEGSKVAPGSTVTIYISKGPKPVETPPATENNDSTQNSGTTDNNDGTQNSGTTENNASTENTGTTENNTSTNTNESTNTGESGTENTTNAENNTSTGQE